MLLLSILGSLLTVAPPGARASTDLTCASAYSTDASQAACRAYSDSLDAIMRTITPAEYAILVSRLSAGMTINGVTIQCDLSSTCDALPVSAAAFAARYGGGLGTLSTDDDVRTAMNAILGSTLSHVVEPVTAIITNALRRSAAPDLTTRIGLLEREVSTALADLQECDGCVDVDGTARGVVGLVVTALLAVPSMPGASAYYSHGVQTFNDTDPLVDALAGGLIAVPSCGGFYEYAQWLNVEKEGFSDNMVQDSGFGIYKMQWADPSNHRGCPQPRVDITASLQANMTSNYNSWIASKTKYGKLAYGNGTLAMGDPGYVYGPRQKWETDAVEFDYSPPLGFDIHYFGPPAGMYQWVSAGRLTMSAPYAFTDTGKRTRDVKAYCTKHGSADSTCWVDELG